MSLQHIYGDRAAEYQSLAEAFPLGERAWWHLWSVWGQYDLAEGLALGECAVQAPDGPILEIGSLQGRSLCFIAHALLHADKVPPIWAVDTWYSGQDLRRFEINIASLGYPGMIYSMQADSRDVARTWNRGVALLHIDADHSEEGASRDVWAFAPWVLPGGYLCLHDYREGYPGVVSVCDGLAQGGDYEAVEVVDQCWMARRKS